MHYTNMMVHSIHTDLDSLFILETSLKKTYAAGLLCLRQVGNVRQSEQRHHSSRSAARCCHAPRLHCCTSAFWCTSFTDPFQVDTLQVDTLHCENFDSPVGVLPLAGRRFRIV